MVSTPSESFNRLRAALADRYYIERELGAGGMATVYLAEDVRHQRKVALKVLKTELTAQLGARRFLMEIQLTANLQHPNILPVYDSGEVDGVLYYVMPYVEGDTLRHRLDREKQLGVDDTIAIATAVARALHYAHERDVIHRDVKPENILMASGEALLADFGIARHDAVTDASRLTGTGLSVGTPRYMSPEQAMGDRTVDARSDVYALGATVYEMLVGEPPHGGRSAQVIVAKLLSEEPTPLTRIRPSVPAHVNAAVLRALAKSPADRFPSAAQFAEALTEPAAGRLSSGNIVLRRLSNRRVAFIGAGLLLLFGIGFTTIWNRLSRPGSATASPGAGSRREATTLAVLPFENSSADTSWQFFADGLADQLINAFSRLDGLRVAPRMSSFQFKGQRVDVREIGARLGVSKVVEASVTVTEGRLRVAARLVDVHGGYLLWSHEYSRMMDDVFRLQEEIAQAIVNTLGLRLVGDSSRAVVKSYTDRSDAYQAYLRGRYEQDQIGRAGGEAAAKRSISAFREALRRDPAYALAWAGIADTYAHYLADTYWAPRDAYPLAGEAASRAIELDPNLAEARVALAGVKFWYQWDLQAALDELSRAIALDAQLQRAHWLRGLVLHSLSRYHEGQEAWRTAASLDPSPYWSRWHRTLLVTIRPPPVVLARTADSLREAARTDPDDATIWRQLSIAEYLSGNFDRFLELTRQHWPNEIRDAGAAPTDRRAAIAVALARVGQLQEARSILAGWRKHMERAYASPHYVAKALTSIGSSDEAFDWLSRAVHERDAPMMVWLDIDPAWDPIRADRRFQAIRRLAGRPH